LAQELLPAAQAADYNQAMMDFGALQCTPQSPQCLLCPLQESCMALREGRVETLPVKLKTLKVKERHLTYVYIRCNGYTAIRRRGEGDIWQGLWEPYLIENSELRIENSQLIKKAFRHVLTHRVLLCDFYLLETSQRPSLPDGYQWVKEENVEQYALPRMIELLLKMLPVR
jgi:A/G-specific adenine glycosylase